MPPSKSLIRTKEPFKALPPQYKSLLFLLESCTSFRKALQIQTQLLITGLQHQRLILSKLISFFSLSSPNPSSLSHSLLIFSHLRRPNVFIYNTLIRAFARSKTPLKSVSIYKCMLSKGQTSPNNFTFPLLVAACGRLSLPESGWQVHCHVVKLGFDLDVHVRNSLIDLYSCFGELAAARYLFDEFAQWGDSVSFNIMISGYNKGGNPVNGLLLFKDMIDLGVRPDERTLVCLMSACSMLENLKSGKVVHMFALKNLGFDCCGNTLGVALADMYAKLGAMKLADRVFNAIGASKNIVSWSCMVSGYAKCGEIEIARRIFDAIPEKDLVSWTSMISAYSQNGRYKEALEVYEQMVKERIKPDEVTLVAVLSACAHLGYLDLGKRLHLYIEDGFLIHENSWLCTAIVDMYAKCGCIGTALEIFDRIDKKLKSTSLFNSMISGLAQHGLGEIALTVFKEMKALGLIPDEITFVGVLCACSHSGLIEEGKAIYDMMVKQYGMHPQIEHYGCMVDLLGRGGYLDEAYVFTQNMPISPNSVIWATLLRNCRVHRNAKIGEIAERKLIQLGSNEGRSSLPIEMFLDVTSRENTNKIRKVINYKPAYKQQGCSYVESNGYLHEFVSTGYFHPQSADIYMMLDEMRKRIRPEQGLLDIEGKEKRNDICHHSEWPALAFGLINFGPREIIRIIMDHRMCTDCHSSFKHFSKALGREILMRDKIRFHHIKNGLCSCLDYW